MSALYFLFCLTCESKGKYLMSMSQVVTNTPPGSQCTSPDDLTRTRIFSKSLIISSALQTKVVTLSSEIVF